MGGGSAGSTSTGGGGSAASGASRPRVAVVGHVEWVEFLRVERVPAPGEIAHAAEAWALPGGGGAVAAVQLARLAGEAVLFTALGDEPLGRRAADQLRELGVRVEATFRPTPQRRAVTWVDARGERTITVVGERLGPSGDDPLPWEELRGAEAVYFTAGDGAALSAARRARVLVAASRALPQLMGAGVRVDVLVGSALDPAERYRRGDLDPAPAVVVRTEGAAGGSFETSEGDRGRYRAARVPGPVVDTYGAGDSFAAGLTFALGRGQTLLEALDLAARCGAACLSGRGPYEAQLRLPGAAATIEEAGSR